MAATNPSATGRSPEWDRLQPGVYVDRDGGMHVELPTILAANGYADTPANRDMILYALRQACPDAIVTVEE